MQIVDSAVEPGPNLPDILPTAARSACTLPATITTLPDTANVPGHTPDNNEINIAAAEAPDIEEADEVHWLSIKKKHFYSFSPRE